MKFGRKMVPAILWLGTCLFAGAQVTYSVISSADAFLATGSPGNPAGTDLTGQNFGGAGVLAIAPASSVKGEFQSVVRFNLTNGVALFNATYGSNNWSIAEIDLELTSNYGASGEQPNNGIFNAVSGGKFVIEWLSNNNWDEGTGTPNLFSTNGVAYDSLPDLLTEPHEVLCTNTYTPPGDNVPVTWPLPLDTNLVAEIKAGGEVSLLFYAADDQIGYLFNSYNYGRGNEPRIQVTANPLLRILAGYFTNSIFHLTGAGATNSQFEIQAKSSLATTNWQSIGTAMSDSAGVIQFDDTNASGQGQRFYRISF